MTCRLTNCMKSVQIRSFFWSVFSRIRTEYGDLLRENTDQKKLRIWKLFTQWHSLEDAFLGPTQFLTTENPWWEMIKNAFYLTLKALSVLKIFKFLSWHFDNANKPLHSKDKANFKIYDVTTCLTNDCNTHVETLFMKNHTQNIAEKLFPDPSIKKQNWAYLWINGLKFYAVCFYCMLRWGLLKLVFWSFI